MFLAIALAAGLSLSPQAASSTPPASGFAVSGTVVNSISGDPISRAEVSLVPQSRAAEVSLVPQFRGQETLTVASDSSGHFSFTGVSAGRYTLTAVHRGFVPQSYLQHGQNSSAVVVGADLDDSNLVLRLPQQGAIAGHIFDQSGDPIRGARVSLFSRDPADSAAPPVFSRGASTDDTGYFRLGMLMPGIYYVGVSAQPWYARHPQTFAPSKPPDANQSGGQIRQSTQFPSAASVDPRLDVVYQPMFFGGATELADAQPVRISAGETETADMTLTAVPARHIRLNMEATPNQFPNVSVYDESNSITFQMSAQVMQIEPGVWEIAGVPPGQITATIRTIDPERRIQNVETIQLGTDQEVYFGATAAGAVVKGVLTGEGGFRAAGTRISLIHSGQLVQVSTIVAADGTFEFPEKIAPGTYEVVVNGAASHFLAHLTATGASATGNTISVGAQNVQLALTVSGAFSKISGFAVSAGKHAPGVLIVLLPQGSTNGVAPTRFYQSDADGSFTLQDVVPGRYSLFALENAWELNWHNADFLGEFAAQGKAVSAESGGDIKIDVPVQNAAQPPTPPRDIR